MKIVLLEEAQRRFEAEDEWWREHRDAKELFVDEFARTLEQLSVYYLHDRERDLNRDSLCLGWASRTRPKSLALSN